MQDTIWRLVKNGSYLYEFPMPTNPSIVDMEAFYRWLSRNVDIYCNTTSMIELRRFE